MNLAQQKTNNLLEVPLKNSISFFLIALFSLLNNQLNAQLNKAYFYNQARQFLNKNQNSETILTINQLIAADSTIAEVWLLRGIAKYGLNDLRGAITDFDRAIRLNPVYTYAYLYRGSAHGQLGAINKSISDYNFALDLRPNSTEALLNRGISYLIAQQFKNALSDFNKVISIEPKNADAWTHRGTALLFLGDTIKSIGSYSQAILLRPSQTEAFSRRGRLYFEKKKFTEALSDLNAAIDLDPNSSVNFFARALTNSSLGNDSIAIADINRSLFLNPNNALGYFNRALLHWKRGKQLDAFADFSKSNDLNPNNILVFYNRAVLALEMNRLVSSLNDLNRALEILPEFTRAYLVRAQVNLKLGNKTNSERDYNKAVELANKHNTAYNQWADTSEHFRKLVSFQSDFISPTQGMVGINTTEFLSMFKVIAGIKKTEITTSFQLLDSINTGNTPFYFSLSTNSPIEALTISDKISKFTTKLIEIQNRGLKQRYSETINATNQLLVEYPNNPILLFNLATEITEMAAFIANFEQEIKPFNVDIYNNQLETRQNSKPTLNRVSVEEPLLILNQLSDKYPQWVHVNYNIGVILTLTGDYSTAIEYFDKCIAYSQMPEAFLNKGYTLLMLNKPNEGCTNLSKAGELGLKNAYTLISKYCQ